MRHTAWCVKERHEQSGTDACLSAEHHVLGIPDTMWWLSARDGAEAELHLLLPPTRLGARQRGDLRAALDEADKLAAA